MIVRRTLIAALVPALTLGLAACGQKGELQRPKTAKAQPVPYGRDAPLTTKDQMSPSPQAVPTVAAELLTKSQPRPDDPFNLPPHE